MEKLTQEVLENVQTSIKNTEKVKKELLPHEKFNILLGLFGTDRARKSFLETCKNYLSARIMHETQAKMSDAENYRTKKITYSPPERANIHNAIMDTISRLATETKNPTPEQSAILRDFYSREDIATAIKSYFTHESKTEYIKDEDEDKPEVKKKDMSDPAYFHYLGKEH